jgi:hypothetical protein
MDIIEIKSKSKETKEFCLVGLAIAIIIDSKEPREASEEDISERGYFAFYDKRMVLD